MNTAAIARLKITLDDVKPVVMRRLEVPLSIRLDRLHLAIQAAMGWTNSHLYEIGPKMSDGGFPIPIGAMGRSTLVKPASLMCLKMSAQRR